MKNDVYEVPDNLKQFVEPGRSKELRLTAARGLVPATPKELLLILYHLTLDEDAEVSGEAGKSLNEMPKDVLSSALGDQKTHPGILDYFARNLTDEPVLERIALNTSAKDETIAFLAETIHSQNLIDVIANNHERLVRSERIVEALGKNPAVLRSTIDRVIEHLRLYLGKDPDIGISDESAEPTIPREELEAVEAGSSYGAEASFFDAAELDEELVEESDDDEHDQLRELRRENFAVKIGMLKIGEKIKLAILGNREARTILVRDPNRIVSKAVLRNPRLTDSEIVLISQSKVVNEEILREIAESRKWARLYQVKLALVNNPKTPPHISLGLIRHLRDFDLRSLRWSKNLPGVITAAIKQVMQERRDRR